MQSAVKISEKKIFLWIVKSEKKASYNDDLILLCKQMNNNV